MSISSTPRRTRVEKGIYQRPDGKFEIGFRDANGKQRWSKVDGGITAARAALVSEHAKRNRGERIVNPRLTFNAALDAAWESDSAGWGRSSLVVYGTSKRRVSEHFGACKLNAIDVRAVAAYVRSHRELSKETLRKDLSMISAAFTHAARDGFSGPNPVTLLKRGERPQGESKPKRILNSVELSALLLATDARHRLAVRTLAETGLRLGELLGLDMAQDLDGTLLSVSRQRDAATGELVKLKTEGSRRSITINESLASELREIEGFPFTHKQVERAVAAAAQRAKLGSVTPHSLRHTHASQLIADGLDIASVSSRLGHANSAITLGVYTHAVDDVRKRDEERRILEARYSSPPEDSNVVSLRSGSVALP